MVECFFLGFGLPWGCDRSSSLSVFVMSALVLLIE